MFIRYHLALVLLALGLVSSHAVSFAQDSPAKITGTVAYRERAALPADADINVVLQDVTQVDAPAQTISQITLPANGRQVPIPFELTYDPQKIVAGHRYSVRATIRAEGLLMYTTAQAYPVITGGFPHRVNLMLLRVGHGTPKTSAAKATAAAPQQASESQPEAAGSANQQPSAKSAIQPEAQMGRQSADAPSTVPASPPAKSKTTKPKTTQTAKAAAPPPATSVAGESSTKQQADRPSLLNSQWKLYELNGKNVFFAPPERPITLAFSPDGGRIAGSAGCNAYMGTFVSDSDEFRLRPADTTMMACSDAVMKREQSFFKMLNAADGYQVDGDILSLTSHGKVLGRLRNSEEDTPAR
jgi:putative lipoprotein